MLRRVLTALIYEVLAQKQSGSGKVPASVKEYLDSVKDDNLLADLALVVELASGRKELSDIRPDCPLLKAFVAFLTDKFAEKLDELPQDFYLLKIAKQKELLGDLIKGEGVLASNLRDLVLANSYQGLTIGLAQLSVKAAGAPYTIVQTPIALKTSEKAKIRKELRDELGELCFPVFQINRNLIGGLRVFVDGEVKDLSWLGRINFITSLTN